MVKQKISRDLIGTVLTALTVIIFVVIAALIVSSITSDTIFTDVAVSGSSINETGLYANSTGSTLDKASESGFTTPVITAAFNYTDGTAIVLTNFTVSDAGLFTNATELEWDNVSLSYTYTYNSGTSVIGITSSDIGTAFGSFVTNLIAFLAVIGTIVGVVWLVMYVKRLFDKKEGLQGISA